MKVTKRNAIIIFAIVGIIAVTAAFYTANLLKKSKYTDISVQEANELIEDKPDLVILDVRTVSEFEDGHIENAVNIPVDELENRLNELDKEYELLVYCRTGNRSRTSVQILNEAGYTKVYHMNKGISVWIQQGYPTV